MVEEGRGSGFFAERHWITVGFPLLIYEGEWGQEILPSSQFKKEGLQGDGQALVLALLQGETADFLYPHEVEESEGGSSLGPFL